ncbi:MAG: hypothetical protein HYV04_04400 [Deltaproteobacteria bacterium]|nr:hypothetical protein [Deltaproteobacteria bacterium]
MPRIGSTEAKQEKEKKLEAQKSAAVSLIAGLNNSNLPPPVKDVLENPSPETAREYVTWRRKGNEALARASEYIVQAEREMGAVEGVAGERIKKKEEIEERGLVALYYFFSSDDVSAREDVRLLNRVWQEEQIGVVGIPVKARDEEVMRFVRLNQPLFPVRKGDEEIRLIGPRKTPDLYLALPLQKKIFRVGSSVTEDAIKEALGKALAEVFKERFGSGVPVPWQTGPAASGVKPGGRK